MGAKFSPAKKALGQNFLHDQHIINKIVGAFNPKDNDVVVEVGPGRGALTEHLIGKSKVLHLIEYDHALAAHWQEKADEMPSMYVHNQNVLKVDFSNIMAQTQAITKADKLRIIGNLPYNISSQILIRLLNNINIVEDIVAMLQLEMVDRICAAPNCKQYGRLSVMLQQAFHCKKLFKVPSGAFTPAPKVESAIVHLVPKPTMIGSVRDQSIFAEVVRTAFSQRRKTLHNNLKKIVSPEIYELLNIEPKLRPENLSVDEYIAIANALTDERQQT